MSIKFPNSPAVGQSFTVNNIKYTWTGSYWSSKSEALTINGDPYLSYVKSLAHADGVDAATTSEDECGFTWTAAGNAQLDTAQSKFGVSSMYFDGTGDYFYVAANARYQLVDLDFTIEGWVKTDTLVAWSTIAAWYNASTTQRSWTLQMSLAGSIRFGYSTNGSTMTYVAGTAAAADNEWHHIAVTRKGNQIKLWVDGAQVGTTDTTIGISSIFSPTTAQFTLGSEQSGNPFKGWLDDFRLTIGVARYTENFVVPSEAFPTKPISVSSIDISGDPYWAQVVSLLNFEGTDGATSTTDEKNNTWNFFDGAQLDDTQSRFGTTSLYLDGTGDYISSPNSAKFQAEIQDLTIEAWVKISDSGTQRTIVNKRDMSDMEEFTLHVSASGLPIFAVGVGGVYYGAVSTTSLIVDTWYHVAGVRHGKDILIFVNGILEDSIELPSGSASALGTNTAPLHVGRDGAFPGTRDWYGWIDSVRFTVGVARYTENFHLPTTAFPTKLGLG